MDNFKIFTTPRRLIRSLQDLDDGNSDYSETQSRRASSPSSSKSNWSPTSPLDRNAQSHTSEGYENRSSDELLYGDDQSNTSEGYDNKSSSQSVEQTKDSFESISSSALAAIVQPKLSHDRNFNTKSGSQSSSTVKVVSSKAIFMWIFSILLILLAMTVSYTWVDNDEGYTPVPT